MVENYDDILLPLHLPGGEGERVFIDFLPFIRIEPTELCSKDQKQVWRENYGR
jgi:hypothetical protein